MCAKARPPAENDRRTLYATAAGPSSRAAADTLAPVPRRPPKTPAEERPSPSAAPRRPPKAAAPHEAHTAPAPCAAPRPPPNPQLVQLHAHVHAKVSTRIHELRTSLERTNAHLRVVHGDLERGCPAITDEMMRLRAVRDVCATTAQRIHATIAAAHQRTIELRARQEPDVDTMLTTTSIVENQCVCAAAS